jgi:hypothetical protein
MVSTYDKALAEAKRTRQFKIGEQAIELRKLFEMIRDMNRLISYAGNRLVDMKLTPAELHDQVGETLREYKVDGLQVIHQIKRMRKGK